MKRIIILGSTGSIGENTLRVVDALPGEFEVVGLAAHRNVSRVLEQAAAHGVRRVAIADPDAAVGVEVPAGVELLVGMDGVCELAADEADIVVCAIVGMAGLRPVLSAAACGTDIAIATKEVLVAAGELVTALCRSTGSRLLPVDSEHSAMFQCLQARGDVGDPTARETIEPKVVDEIDSLILTASGGPFWSRTDLDFETVGVGDALNHPNWSMGQKVTIDSATLMNKGLEVMEAHWLYGVPYDRIRVVIHPESIVHSMVAFTDGNVLAQLSPPDMRYAIQFALTWPRRMPSGLAAYDPVAAGPLTFAEPDLARFPCLSAALDAGRAGGSAPAVANAANEVAVARFLAGKISFAAIPRCVRGVLDAHDRLAEPTLSDIFEVDQWARDYAAQQGV
jgi:1-deoxy-D-xylulose-5-phosphate reductoisomerase